MSPMLTETAKRKAIEFVQAVTNYEIAQKKADGAYLTPKESGALRRASMDLTRALANMRKPLI